MSLILYTEIVLERMQRDLNDTKELSLPYTISSMRGTISTRRLGGIANGAGSAKNLGVTGDAPDMPVPPMHSRVPDKMIKRLLDECKGILSSHKKR